VIEALDAIALAAASPQEAAQAYATLLARGPGARAAGVPASVQLANARLDFVAAPAGQGSDGLAGLTFATGDLAKAQHLLQRRAMRVYMADGHLHLATDSTHGVPVSLVERRRDLTAAVPASDAADAGAAVSGLDHVVIRTPDPERAVALYAGRLGMSLRLDRSEPAWGARLLFFRCGDLIVEVAHDLKAGVSGEPDKLWGLSWRVPDIAATHARLRACGVETSEVRVGRRPGTRIFTVKSHTAGVPTIMIGPDARAAA
jgi:catechol 2,3-dioxygenase-like lactoylglutathione lyase family enzyme